MNYNQQNTQIIDQIKKEICNIRVQVQESIIGYQKKEIYFHYTVKGSLLEKEQKQNSFYYEDEEKKIDKLAQKDPMDIFEFLAHKHLEKNVGYGKNPKQFKTPCYVCNQRSLTTLGWSEEGYPDNLERFSCRLCQTSFSWIDIKDDPLELQLEMKAYYLTFAEKDLEKDEARRKELDKKPDKLEQKQKKRRQFIEEIKASIENLKNHV